MNCKKVLSEKMDMAKIKLLTARDSAYVAQYEHYIVSNSCLFCIAEECRGECASANETGTASERKKIS